HADTEAYVEQDAPGAPGVVTAGSDGRRRLTFGAWDRAADGVASALAERGVGRGDVVALHLPSSVDYAVAYQAAMRLGAVTSGVNLRLGGPERASIAARTRPTVTIVDGTPEDTDDLDSIDGIVLRREELWHAASAAAPRLPVLAPDDVVAVVWTSGSTGTPKGAVFDHRNLQAVAAGTDVLSRPGDRRLSPLPFAHIGYMTRQWDEVAHVVTTVVTPQPWTAAGAIALMTGERVTVGQGVPTQWALVLAHPDLDDADLSALRIAGTGASRVPAELVRAMRERLGCPVVVRYTSTETALGTGTRPDDPDDVVATTVGRPVPGVELELVDDHGAPVAPGDVGRVRMRSGAAMRGYVAHEATDDRAGGIAVDPVATAAVRDAGGWISTGDVGRLRPDGNLELVGRLADMYIRGGYNVYPSEVEAVLGHHELIGEVAVVGVDDPVLGEIGAAFVVPAGSPDPDLAELRGWCAAHLADYKAPDRLHLVATLPVTSMGKIDKRVLKEMARQHTASEAARSPEPSTRGAR
ncbi:MAG TPA: AMP-binding protein, partial [Acidimicrobiales bacterium]|nr:AMP-binding protein [Acidimicrobiales bacterium]